MPRTPLPVLISPHQWGAQVTTIDGREHLISDFALAERWRDGRYQARCGAWVVSASLCEPPGQQCALCRCVAQVAHAHTRNGAAHR